jgi:hypothetical protein
MMQLLCGENYLEYTGSGWFQCGRHVNCPKKLNNKVLGFDCLLYVDNLPDGCKIDIPEKEITNDNLINISTVTPSSGGDIVSGDHIVSHKTGPVQIIPASEQIVHGIKQ